MIETKEIIIVAPKQYKNQARKLSHEISKKNMCNAAVWSIKQFEDNEFQLGGNRYAIFIGSPDENSLTKDFLPIIDNLKNNEGICYGYNGTKAVVYGEGRLNQIKPLKQAMKKAQKNKIAAGLAALLALLFAPLILIIPTFMTIRAKKKNLIKDQTKVASTYFLDDTFNNWLTLES